MSTHRSGMAFLRIENTTIPFLHYVRYVVLVSEEGLKPP